MIAHSFIFGALLCLSIPASAAPQPLHSSEKWVVNFDDVECFASRAYGAGDDSLVLTLKTPPQGEVVQLTVIERGESGRYARQLQAAIAIDGRPVLQTTALAFAADNPDRRVYRLNIPASALAAMTSARTLSVAAGDDLEASFALDDLDRVSSLLERCVTGLRSAWNIQLEGSAIPVLRQEAQGDIARLFNRHVYPDVALRSDQGGTTTVAILIDERGRVADCTVVGTSGAALLDAQSCAIIREQARFKPAMGLNGNPAKSSLLQRITWRVR